MMKKHLLSIILLCLLFSLTACSRQTSGNSSTSDGNTQLSGKHHIAIEVNNYGTIDVELDADTAPITVTNFINLANSGFYNGLTFHRVIDGFMIQGGDPTGTGMGGPGYKIKDEFGEGLKHDDEGILSMANAGPNTGGSQFFITLAPTPWLNGHHAIFGKVVEGMDVVRLIGVVPTDFRDRPREAVTMEKVEVVK